MPYIERVVLQNFKRFRKRTALGFARDLNVLVGDNEAGKSSVLLAIDLVLAASRSRIEHVGVDTLLSLDAVNAFMDGPRHATELPEMRVEVYLTDSGNPDYNGKSNSDLRQYDGLKMVCAIADQHLAEVAQMLKDPHAPFPYEYYNCSFSTFADHAYFGARKHVRHLMLDSSRVDSEHAAREYTRALFAANLTAVERCQLHSAYRRSKQTFTKEHLGDANSRTPGFTFGLRTTVRANLETDLTIHESSVPLDLRGKGRQCQIKTEFALKRGAGDRLDVLLLEEPENHLSHSATRRLIDGLAERNGHQIILTTHSSLICARLDLRKAQLLGTDGTGATTLDQLGDETARFFMKAPDNRVLEFALSDRVILVEGDAEFILMEAFYEIVSGSTLARDRVHVIAVGGTSFKRYLDLARHLRTRTAVVRDNDGAYQANCIDNYALYQMDHVKVFADPDDTVKTFENAVYDANRATCEALFSTGRRRLSVPQYMLANKTDAAFELLSKHRDELIAPDYIREAIEWIRR